MDTSSILSAHEMALALSMAPKPAAQPGFPVPVLSVTPKRAVRKARTLDSSVPAKRARIVASIAPPVAAADEIDLDLLSPVMPTEQAHRDIVTTHNGYRVIVRLFDNAMMDVYVLNIKMDLADAWYGRCHVPVHLRYAGIGDVASWVLAIFRELTKGADPPSLLYRDAHHGVRPSEMVVVLGGWAYRLHRITQDRAVMAHRSSLNMEIMRLRSELEAATARSPVASPASAVSQALDVRGSRGR